MSKETNFGPVLFMSNHPPMVREFFGIKQLHKQRDDLVVMCDAALEGSLKRFGLNVLGVDSPDKEFWGRTKAQRARIKLLRMFGEITHAYDNALKGSGIIDGMLDTLKDGKDLFVTPSGVSEPKAPWRAGIGLLGKKIIQEDLPVRAGFIYIPNSMFRENVVEVGPTVGTLLADKEGILRSREVALILQKEYTARMFEKGNLV